MKPKGNVIQIFLISIFVKFPFSEAQHNDKKIKTSPETPDIVDQFEFEFESTGYLDVRTMESYDTMPGWQNNALVQLSKEEITRLCLRVKEYLSLDGMTFPEGKSFFPLLDKMIYPGTRSRYYIGMSCDTIPTSWLRVIDNEKKKIMIMIEDWYKYQNGNYTFEIRSIKPHQVRKLREYNSDGYFESSRYWNSERVLICFFAKKRVKELMLIPEEPSLQEQKTEEHAIYNIDLLHGAEKHIAFSCSSFPRMYAYFDTSVDRHVVTVLVDEKTQTVMDID